MGKRFFHRLTDRVCRQAGPGRHADGCGLYLDVRPSGSRAFVQRIVVNGRRCDNGLGGYPVTTLAKAREKGMDNLRVRDEGGDPLALRREKKRVPVLSELLETVINVRRPSWRGSQTDASWRRSFTRYVFPIVGDIPIDKVTIKHLTKIVEPHWLGRGSAGYLASAARRRAPARRGPRVSL